MRSLRHQLIISKHLRTHVPPNLHAACFIVSHEQILWCFPPLFLVWSFGDQAPHTQSLRMEPTRAEQPVPASLLEETADGYHVPTRGISFVPSSSFYPLPLASVSTFPFLFLDPFAYTFLAVPSHSLPAERRQEEQNTGRDRSVGCPLSVRKERGKISKLCKPVWFPRMR